MGQMVNEQIQIKCRFTSLFLLDCSIHAQYGEHTTANVTLVVNSEESELELMNTAEENLVISSRIMGGVDDGIEKILFSGIINTIELIEEGGYTVLSLSAVSSTWKMDIKRRSRSFQNLAMTYKDVAEIVAKEYGAEFIWDGGNKQLEFPLIQYKETDYHFLKRVLSHMQKGLTVGDSSPKVCIHTGVRNGIDKGMIDLNRYSHSLVPYYTQKFGRKQLGWQTGYKIKNMDFVRVGDYLRAEGRLLYIMETHTTFSKGVLECCCVAFPRQCFRVEKMSAETLKGVVLNGRILETRQELVKIHLDIDKKQSVSEAYEFPWKPITGNMLYCMPEAGTKAALYFGEADESTGAVIYNIRENGERCISFTNYNNRCFTSDGQKMMYLEPKRMGLLNVTRWNAEIALSDSSGFRIVTSNRLSVLAEGQVELKGKNVTIITPKEATLVRKDFLSPTVINLCNAFDSIGVSGGFTSNALKADEKEKKSGLIQEVEEYSLDDVLDNVLSNIPTDNLGDPVMEAVAASMPVISSANSIRRSWMR